MLFQGGQLFYKMIVIVRSLRRRRTDILDVRESTLDVGEQTIGERTVIHHELRIVPDQLLYHVHALFRRA